MNRYKKSRLVVVVSVLSLLSSSLLFLTAYQGLKIPFVTDAVEGSLSLVETVISKPVQFLSEQKDGLSDLVATYKENQELKQTIAELQDTAAENASLKDENESLRQSLEVKENYADKKIVSALVSVRTPNAWNQEIFLNIGQKDGVTSDMLVVANGGLIGVVDTLEESSTAVKLLTNSDDFSKIAVKISTGSSDVYGILTGYDTDSHSFIVNQLNSNEEIPAGSNVVTSDLAGGVPSNIQIGKVASVKTSSSNLNRELYVEPTADFSNIYSVTVIGQ